MALKICLENGKWMSLLLQNYDQYNLSLPYLLQIIVSLLFANFSDKPG
jgi:hypothetical protein